MWLTLDPADPMLKLAVSDTNRRLQTYLDDSDYWTYDSQGVRNQRLMTLHARRYNDRSTIYLESIRMEGDDHEGRSWQLSAGSGELAPDTNQLTLLDNVEVTQGNGLSKLITDHLEIDTQKKVANTQAAVTLIHESSITRAQGLSINLPEGTAELLSDVETIYEMQ